MLRLIGFFVLVLFLANLLGHLPIIGPIFARTGCLGIWLSAMLLSWGLSKWGERMLLVRRGAGELRQHLAVDSPHNHGKAGTLYLNQGRTKKAVEHLALAAEGEPDVAEWHYRLGLALSASRKHEEAARAFERCVAIDAEHAYGAAQMRWAETLTTLGRCEEAFAALQTLERNHGPSPESAYRRGLALKKGGARKEARAAFGEVAQLAAESARYQRKSTALWVTRASLAKLF